MLHISSDQLDYRIAKSFFSLTFWKYIIISKYLLPIQNCPFTNRKCQIYCFDLLSTKYKGKIHVLRENTTNNSRNSLPVLSAIWTFWKTTAAKHIFGDISNFFFQKWRLEIISVEFSHYSSANFRCWETKKNVFFYDSLSSLQQLSLKKSDKKILLFAFNWFCFIYLTWHSKDPIILVFLTIQGISSKRSTFQSFIHWKYRSIKFFFLKKRKNGYGGCCTYWFFCCYQKVWSCLN